MNACLVFLMTKASWARTFFAGVIGGMTFNLAMLLTFCAIGFGWNGKGVLLDPSLQSQKLIAVWTKIEPLPLVVSRPVPIVAGIVCFGIAARSLRMAALVFILSFAFWEFFTPFNQFGEPLPLIALELVFWAVIAAAEGFALSSVFEIRPDRSDGPGKTQGKNTIN